MAETALHRKLGAAVAFSEDDTGAIDGLLGDRQAAMAGATLVPEGHVGEDAYVLLTGWAIRFRMFEDGRRQISRLFLPGDFIGLNASYLRIPEQCIAALTDVEFARCNARMLMEVLRQSPRLWFAFLWSETRDRYITEERVASIGRRSAHERLAHILLELQQRLELVGEASANSFTLPLTQEHLADVLGLTSIHVNRVMRRLKEDGLVAADVRTIRLLDRERLTRIADFDPRYLIHARLS